MNHHFHDEQTHLFTAHTLKIAIVTIILVTLAIVIGNAAIGWILDVKEMIQSNPAS